MPTWVTTATTITDRYEGALDPTEDWPRLQVLIDEAEAVLLAHFPDLPQRISSNLVSVDVVRIVVRAAVMRLLRNPGGHASQAAGEVSIREGVPTSDSAAYTSRELAMISGSIRRRPGTIYVRPPSPWQDTA